MTHIEICQKCPLPDCDDTHPECGIRLQNRQADYWQKFYSINKERRMEYQREYRKLKKAKASVL